MSTGGSALGGSLNRALLLALSLCKRGVAACEEWYCDNDAHCTEAMCFTCVSCTHVLQGAINTQMVSPDGAGETVLVPPGQSLRYFNLLDATSTTGRSGSWAGTARATGTGWRTSRTVAIWCPPRGTTAQSSTMRASAANQYSCTCLHDGACPWYRHMSLSITNHTSHQSAATHLFSPESFF